MKLCPLRIKIFRELGFTGICRGNTKTCYEEEDFLKLLRSQGIQNYNKQKHTHIYIYIFFKKEDCKLITIS